MLNECDWNIRVYKLLGWKLDIEGGRVLKTEGHAWVEGVILETDGSVESGSLLAVENRMPKLMIWDGAVLAMIRSWLHRVIIRAVAW